MHRPAPPPDGEFHFDDEARDVGSSAGSGYEPPSPGFAPRTKPQRGSPAPRAEHHARPGAAEPAPFQGHPPARPFQAAPAHHVAGQHRAGTPSPGRPEAGPHPPRAHEVRHHEPRSPEPRAHDQRHHEGGWSQAGAYGASQPIPHAAPASASSAPRSPHAHPLTSPETPGSPAVHAQRPEPSSWNEPAPPEPAARGPLPAAAPPPPPAPARAARAAPARQSVEDAVQELLAVTSYPSPRHQLEAWLAVMCKVGASDLILRAGGRPSHRTDGKIGFLPGRVPDSGPLVDVLEGILGKPRMDVWRERGSADASLHLDGLGRFRLNAYRQMGEPAVVIRRINEQAPNLDDLDLPAEALRKLALRKRGLVLVTGIAGSGKSTTLAAMIQSMNESLERHIVTLEDPIELLFKEQRCVISQREIGTDCGSFHEGLRHALRQSPDVILIGEMRDAETVTAALDATETGHLVMSTLHTVNAPQTVERILSFYRAEQHQQVRLRLAENMAAVLSQRLIPRSGGKGMIPAFELMQSTPHIRELLQEGKTAEMSRVIEAGSERGLISFNMCLRRLVQERKVELNDALAASDRPEELILALRGITGSAARVDTSAVHQKPPPGPDGLRMTRS